MSYDLTVHRELLEDIAGGGLWEAEYCDPGLVEFFIDFDRLAVGVKRVYLGRRRWGKAMVLGLSWRDCLKRNLSIETEKFEL